LSGSSRQGARPQARPEFLTNRHILRRPGRTRFLMKVITRQATAGEDTDAALRLPLRFRQQVYGRDLAVLLSPKGARRGHDYLLGFLRRWSIPALRLTLGLIFLWFGVLKLFDASPVAELLKNTYTFLPLQPFAITLGAWEVLMGVGLMLKRAMRCTLCLLCAHLTGTFIALWLAPALFFQQGNPLWLTAEGEFVIKNMVLISAALVIGGYEVAPLDEREKAAPAAHKGACGEARAALERS
jgi:putative oxidoreductase